MNKYLVVLIVLGLASCTAAKDEQYYRSHPKQLQEALKACPNQQPQGLTCPQIEELGGRLNNLAYQLQSNPQGFGHKILSLQETLAKQKSELKKNKTNTELKASVEQNKNKLADYLAIVKWLESPES